MIEVVKFVFNPFQENTFLLYDETSECIIVDPGCFEKDEEDLLRNFIISHGLIPVKVVLTHAHVDHICGAKFLFEEYGLKPECHEDELSLFSQAKLHGMALGFTIDPPPTPTHFLEEGKEVIFGNSELKIIHVPGHSKGSVALFSEKDSFVLTGDVLFSGSIGRTDLPGGNYEVIMKSIRKKILPLGDEVVVYSGHGPDTSILEEKKSNPFVKQAFL